MRLLVKLVISGVLLAYLLQRAPLHMIWQQLSRLDARALIVACAVSLAAWWLSAVRLWCLLPEFRLRQIVRVTFTTLFYATALPGQIAGDVVKAYRLGRQSVRAGHAEAATLVDRGLAVFALFLLSAFASAGSARIPLVLRWFFIGGTVGLALAGALAASRMFRHGLIEYLLPQGKGPVRGFVRHFSIALHDCLRRPWRMLAAFALALLFHAMCIVIQVVLGHALHIPLTWLEWTVVYASVSLLVLLPISVAGLGLREGGYVGLLAWFGVSASLALSVSFTMFGLLILGALLGAALELTEPDNVGASAKLDPESLSKFPKP